MRSSQYEVLAVRYGTRQASAAEVFLNYHSYHEPDRPLRMGTYFFYPSVDRSPNPSPDVVSAIDTVVAEQIAGHAGPTRLLLSPARPPAGHGARGLVTVERIQVAGLAKNDQHVAGLQLKVAGRVGDQLPAGAADQQRYRRPAQLLQGVARQRGPFGDRQFL